MSLKRQKVKPLNRETFLAVIKNSVGSKMFQNLFAWVDGEKVNITKEGNLSCSFFVSSVLTMFGLIKSFHSTVGGTTNDLLASGWKIVRKPKPGDVLMWEERVTKNGAHYHLGFFIGNDRAISNISVRKVVGEHDWLFGGQRKVIAIYHKNIKENRK